MRRGEAGGGTDAMRVLAHHGRSFHWASRLLGPADAERMAVLYAFCRRVDDLVDEKPADEAREALASVKRDCIRGASRDPAVDAFLALARETGIPERVPPLLLDALALDLGAVRMESAGDLVRYGYGVAGTVGIMSCAVLGVHDGRALPFAVDLGVGMQLTNIARDVVEDATRDRIYLPRTWITPRVTPEALVDGDPAARTDAFVAVRRVLDLADRHYRSADLGMRFLPRRARLGILTASRVYEGIGDVVRRDGFWDRRAVVAPGTKARLTLRAIGAQLFRPRYWSLGRAPGHDPTLHVPLRGLPGADPAA